ncbi:MAG TPA: CCA tRNA nucleotidyltransferase [Tepidisphaeraceae bacterium]|jgi:poly(A) polymerase
MTEPIVPSSKPRCSREDALAVLKRLRDAGHVAYFAGGCVRDELLGITPKDYDVATDAPPGRVRELFRNTQAVGAAFGVILVRQAKSIVEVATFRSEGAYLDGRRPSEVHFTTAEEDAKRRDFTINGLFLDPVEEKVIDYVGGQEDLKKHRIRAIGIPAERFAEDFLRLLRAVRFAARFDFEIDPSTFDAIKQNAPKLAQISPERIAEELRAMLVPPTRTRAARQLVASGLLAVIMRFMPETTAAGQERCGVLKMMSPPHNQGSISFGAALAAICLDYRIVATGKLMIPHFTSSQESQRVARALRQALKLSNEEVDQLTGVLTVRPLLQDPSVATMKRFLAEPTSTEACLLLEALARCDIMNMRISDVMGRLREIQARGPVAPEPLLTGDHLVAAGWTPGPAFKRVLDQVYDAQLEDRIKTKPEALALAEQLRPSPPPSPPRTGERG